jgi:hypothetical protein
LFHALRTVSVKLKTVVCVGTSLQKPYYSGARIIVVVILVNELSFRAANVKTDTQVQILRRSFKVKSSNTNALLDHLKLLVHLVHI